MLEQDNNFSILQMTIAASLAAVIGASIATFATIYIWALIAISSLLSLLIVKLFFDMVAKVSRIDDKPSEAILVQTSNPRQNNSTAPNELFGAALNAIFDPIIILDDEQRIIIANSTARKKYPTFAIGARVETLIRTQEILDALENVVGDKSRRDFDLIEHFPQRRYYQVSVSAFLVSNQYNYIIAIKDETDLRAAEQTRADFLANVGHELRTPLAGISGFIETLSGPARDDEKARDKFLGIMQKQADRMGRLINDILSLTKIELNEHLKPTSMLNLVETLDSMIATVKAANGEKCPEIKVFRPEMAFKAIGDEDEIQQVIINILENAIKYGTPKKPIEVYLSFNVSNDQLAALTIEKWPKSNSMRIVASQPVEAQKFALLRIENQGQGIERRNMPRLSERFYRIDSDNNDAVGTGLGLAIVKHIIARHEGVFCVESEIGMKTAFTFGLPMPNSE